MVKLWTLILITGGMNFPYANYPSRHACVNDATIFYGEMMGRNIGEVVCVSEDDEIVYVTRQLDAMNREARKPRPPKSWAEREKELDEDIAACKAGQQWGKPAPTCVERLTRKKQELYNHYHKRK